jgi:hypothetical protein
LSPLPASVRAQSDTASAWASVRAHSALTAAHDATAVRSRCCACVGGSQPLSCLPCPVHHTALHEAARPARPPSISSLTACLRCPVLGSPHGRAGHEVLVAGPEHGRRRVEEVVEPAKRRQRRLQPPQVPDLAWARLESGLLEVRLPVNPRLRARPVFSPSFAACQPTTDPLPIVEWKWPLDVRE